MESETPARKMDNGDDWPRISIVTPSYNQGRYIEETIRSILLQNYPNIEYIIIDGGSTDETLDVIRKYEPWLTFWVREPDNGQSHAINKGFSRCSGDIYNWLCSDDILLSGALEYIARRMVLGAPCWLVGGVQAFDEKNGNTLFRPAPQFFSIVNFLFWQTMSLPQSSVFWNRRLQEARGGLDQNLHFCMDTDLWLRFFYVTAPTLADCELSRYRIHANAKTTVYSSYYQQSLNEYASWLLTILEREANGEFRAALIAGLCEMQRQTIAWRRVREHVVLGRILRWWKYLINRELPID